MDKLGDTIQTIIMLCNHFLNWFLGGYDPLFCALFVFIVIDYLSSVMCAIVDKNSFQEVGVKTICKKIFIFLLVGLSNVIDAYIIGTGSPIRQCVIYFYLAHEGKSILKKAIKFKLPVPEKIEILLNQCLKQGSDSKK